MGDNFRNLKVKWKKTVFQTKIMFQENSRFFSCSVQFSRSVVSDSSQPHGLHGLQHARLPCPSPTPAAYSNSCPLSWWCHPTISSSVIPFSSCLQSFPAAESFPTSQFFASGGRRINVPQFWTAHAVAVTMTIIKIIFHYLLFHYFRIFIEKHITRMILFNPLNNPVKIRGSLYPFYGSRNWGSDG